MNAYSSDLTRIFCQILVLLMISLLMSSCAAKKVWYSAAKSNWQTQTPPSSSTIRHSVYLVGDAGKVYTGDPVMTMLRKQLIEQNEEQNAVVFLGDNIYPAGLPEVGDPSRATAEKRLKGQMDAVKGAPAWSVFIPGNHDWNDQGKGGWEGIKRQAEFVSTHMSSDSSFYPENGCAGPVVIHPHPDLALVLVDTEWWLHKFEKPDAPEDGCPNYTKEGFIQALKDVMEKHKDKHIVICQHHPFFTNGNHGGRYRALDHLFPLQVFNDNLYIPLPLLGTLYVVLRKAGISPEDLPGKPYKELKAAMMDAVAGNKHIVISAGHEHILQYNRVDNVHHILSGSGAKVSYGRTGKGADFVHMHRGYARVNYYTDGSAWAEYWEPGETQGEHNLIFRQHLYGGNQ